MATTTNFGWDTPDDTDLVKDGALAIRTLGSSIDTSFVDLKGGTTGQVLSKASNTDLDYTWVTTDDANAIQNAIVDAKGDLIAASAADTPARLAVGNNGETLVADSAATVGLRYQGNYAAGKNKIINGAFDVWQRGTSITFADNAYTADRFIVQINSGSAGTGTVTQQTFTAGTAPVAGYEGQYFWRYNLTATGTSVQHYVGQRIEDVRTFAGQTVTFSFWGKADSNRTITSEFLQLFGSGGSSAVSTAGTTHSFTTAWQRFTVTVTVPSVSGKTIGAGSYLFPRIYWTTAANSTIDIWGVQVEAGSVATAFQTATGNFQSELAACQRYYFELADGLQQVGFGRRSNATTLVYSVPVTTTMRTSPSVTYTGSVLYEGGGSASSGTLSAPSVSLNRANIIVLTATTSGTPASGEAYIVDSGKHTFSAEL